MSEPYHGESSSSGRRNASHRNSITGSSTWQRNAAPSRGLSSVARKTGANRQGYTPQAYTRPTGQFSGNVSSHPARSMNSTPQSPTVFSWSGDQRTSIITPSTPKQSPNGIVSKVSPLRPLWRDTDAQHYGVADRTRKDVHSKRPEAVRRWYSHARKRVTFRNDREDGNDVEMESASDSSGNDSDGQAPDHAAFVQAVPNGSNTPFRKLTAIKSARKRPEVISDDDEDEEDSSGVEDGGLDIPPQTDGEETEEDEDYREDDDDSSSSDSVEFIEDEPKPRPRRRPDDLMEVSPMSSRGGSPFIAPPTSLLSPVLLRAIKPHLPPLSKENLPMRPRHLRLAFERKCIMHGVMTAKVIDEQVSLLVLYRRAMTTSGSASRQNQDDHNGNDSESSPGPRRNDNSYTVKFIDWKCPLCSFHGAFNTRQMLKSHLEWDHEDAKVLWDQGTEDEDFTWRIILTFDDPSERSYRDDDDLSGRPFIYAHPIYIDSRENTPVPTLGTPTPAPEVKHEIEESDSRMTSPFIDPPTSRSPSITASLASSSSSKLEIRSPSPDSMAGSVPPTGSFRSRSTASVTSTTTTATADSRVATPVIQTPIRTTRSILQPTTSARRPARLSNYTATAAGPTTTTILPFPDLPPPPPSEDYQGPAARPPYLPTQTPRFIAEKNQWEIRYLSHSCRPHGETLYDLLGVLPLDQYGLMSWQVLDTEEEIFESDDLRDECKVICALWARWIFLNRRKFVANFYFGTLAFIEEYDWMIYWAAGWGALRYQLLLLMANRFLTVSQVANLLKHYQSRVHMDSWYENRGGQV